MSPEARENMIEYMDFVDRRWCILGPATPLRFVMVHVDPGDGGAISLDYNWRWGWQLDASDYNPTIWRYQLDR